MAILTQCPHCKTNYRLKEEHGGKKAICQNSECRKPFLVPTASEILGANLSGDRNPAKGLSKPPVDIPPMEIDAEAVAAEALRAISVEAHAGEVPVDKRVIKLTCPFCDTKWDVPWDRQGKNVLCVNEDCRQRVKVPEQKEIKPADWRKEDTGPSMRKKEELEGVVASVGSRLVSGDALREAGVLKEEFEPRPKWHYAAVVLVPLFLISALVFGIMSWREGKRQSHNTQYMAEAVKELRETKELAVAKGEAPLYRAQIFIAGGEHYANAALKETAPEKLTESIKLFATARTELASIPGNAKELHPVRDLLYMELAVKQCLLGGSESEVEKGVRIRWAPEPTGGGKPKGNVKVFNLQQELAGTFQDLRRDEASAPLATRQAILRQVTATLAATGHGELALDLVGSAFADTDQVEASCQALVEIVRLGGDPAKAHTRLKELPNPTCPEALALAQVVTPPISEMKLPAPPSTSGNVDEGARKTHMALLAMKKSRDESGALAIRPGDHAERLKAIALAADWGCDGGILVRAAKDSTIGTGHDISLIRIIAAGAASDPDAAESLAKNLENDGLKLWAKGEIARGRAMKDTSGKPVDPLTIELPAREQDRHIGLLRARLLVTRWNAKKFGEPANGRFAFDSWEKSLDRPFGFAGTALGLQDAGR